jgi:hypothetical protein
VRCDGFLVIVMHELYCNLLPTTLEFQFSKTFRADKGLGGEGKEGRVSSRRLII